MYKLSVLLFGGKENKYKYKFFRDIFNGINEIVLFWGKYKSKKEKKRSLSFLKIWDEIMIWLLNLYSLFNCKY